MGKKAVKLYGLVAMGSMALLEGSNKIASTEVWLSRAEAQGHRQAFLKSCTEPYDDRDMGFLDPKEWVEVRVREHFLSYEPEEGDVFHAGWEELADG